jgi:hypothetical protein
MSRFQQLLPSQARQALTQELLQKLEAAPLDHYADPTYRYSDALRDFDHEGGWVRDVLASCFQDAEALYRAHHPKRFTDGRPSRA